MNALILKNVTLFFFFFVCVSSASKFVILTIVNQREQAYSIVWEE
jgi:hypothetical protein